MRSPSVRRLRLNHVASLAAAAIVLVGAWWLESGSSLRLAHTPVLTAAFQTAVSLAEQTAFGGPHADLLCLATRADERGQPSDPGDDVVQAVTISQHTLVLPVSRCRIGADNPPQLGVQSLVFDPATGRRGLLVEVAPPHVTQSGRVLVDVSYYEHGRSGAHWTCAARLRFGGWVVDACDLKSIS